MTMVVPLVQPPDIPSSPDTEDDALKQLASLTQSGRTSPTSNEAETLDETVTATQKKKKKKKSKKSIKSKDATTKPTDAEIEGRPPVLCISRNKHWRYISSYHGPWLQLPVELLDSLFTLNLDPGTSGYPEPRPLLPPSPTTKPKDRGLHAFGDFSPPDSPRNNFSSLPLPPPFPPSRPGKPTPPPIDPGVFRSVKNIRRLIDEAAELSVRASSGLSAAELGSMRSNSGLGGSPWAAAQSLGINPLGNGNSGGRNVAMSAMRIHRLRALAVQKLAQAYKTDEVASSVMVMQGGSVFDDVAQRVLKVDPNDADAKYVHFFHEKIPSRQLAESTTTHVLDELIAAYPQHLEYYRTRGIVRCFREEFSQATKDFTHALKEARAVRKAKTSHHNNGTQSESRTNKQGKRRKGKTSNHTNGQAPPNGTSPMQNGGDASDGEHRLKHASVSDDAPEPIEPQLLFLRGAAYLQHAIHIIETAVLQLEGISKTASIDGAELRLCYIENGRYGGVEIGNPDGPLGKRDGAKLLAYSAALGQIRENVSQLLKKSIRDHEKFLSHFDSLESPDAMPIGDLAAQTEYAYLLSEVRPGSNIPPSSMDPPPVFTTYHPLIVESHFSVLICHLLLADFQKLLPTFIRTACIVDCLEGYPIFLPPRSMAHAEFIEVLERLANGWRNGIQPHSLSTQRGKSRLSIEGPVRLFLPSSPIFEEIPISCPELDDENIAGSSSSSSTRKNSECNGHGGASFSSSSSVAHEESARVDAAEALDYARILLAPVVKHQREKAEKAAADKLAGKKKPQPINIPLHGPRVEVIIAWLGAVHLPELDGM